VVVYLDRYKTITYFGVVMTEQELMDMKLHEVRRVDNGVPIIRVVDGWIYMLYTATWDTISTAFVPERGK
jgi:hypothetical protein